MSLPQGQNAVPPARLKPATLQSRVKHSTTELPLNVCTHKPKATDPTNFKRLGVVYNMLLLINYGGQLKKKEPGIISFVSCEAEGKPAQICSLARVFTARTLREGM